MIVFYSRIISLFSVVLLTGPSLGGWMDFDPTEDWVKTYIEKQKSMIPFDTVWYSLVIIATITTIASAFLERETKRIFIALLIAAIFLLSFIIITWFGHLPIEKEILTWDINALPENWTVVQDKLLTFHLMRATAALIALVVLMWIMMNPHGKTDSSEVKRT